MNHNGQWINNHFIKHLIKLGNPKSSLSFDFLNICRYPSAGYGVPIKQVSAKNINNIRTRIKEEAGRTEELSEHRQTH